MKTVKEVAAMTGVSVRALHYYDEIGLLKPTETTEAGYRLYGDATLARLQQILLFRELGFPLKEIRRILADPSFDEREALRNQRRLLVMERDRLDDLIRLADQTLKGEQVMSFAAFNRSEIEQAREQYAKEAEARWGGTDAYRENEQKTASYSKDDWVRIQSEAAELYRRFAKNLTKQPDDPAVQKLVGEWQAFITRNFYTCTDEILAGLGKMYLDDPRFTKNIDRYSAGLAAFMSRAIQSYCDMRKEKN
jgi:DNA-binding transcriptional MerR regulator